MSLGFIAIPSGGAGAGGTVLGPVLGPIGVAVTYSGWKKQDAITQARFDVLQQEFTSEAGRPAIIDPAICDVCPIISTELGVYVRIRDGEYIAEQMFNPKAWVKEVLDRWVRERIHELPTMLGNWMKRYLGGGVTTVQPAGIAGQGGAMSTAVFLKNGMAAESANVGDVISFDVPGYSRIWLKLNHDGVTTHDGPFDVPMPGYQLGEADVGNYDATAYVLTDSGQPGAVLGFKGFRVNPALAVLAVPASNWLLWGAVGLGLVMAFSKKRRAA